LVLLCDPAALQHARPQWQWPIHLLRV